MAEDLETRVTRIEETVSRLDTVANDLDDLKGEWNRLVGAIKLVSWLIGILVALTTAMLGGPSIASASELRESWSLSALAPMVILSGLLMSVIFTHQQYERRSMHSRVMFVLKALTLFFVPIVLGWGIHIAGVVYQ